MLSFSPNIKCNHSHASLEAVNNNSLFLFTFSIYQARNNALKTSCSKRQLLGMVSGLTSVPNWSMHFNLGMYSFFVKVSASKHTRCAFCSCFRAWNCLVFILPAIYLQSILVLYSLQSIIFCKYPEHLAKIYVLEPNATSNNRLFFHI